MRRMLLLVVGLLTLALAVPTVSSAHGGGDGKHKKSKKANLTGRSAGTIASFDGTTLTITTTAGGTVAGEVDEGTDIYLVKVAPAAGASTFGRHHGDDDDDRGHHKGWWKGHRWGWFDRGDPSDLVAGTTVWKAELELDEDGAEWEKVKLIVPATPPPGDT